MDLDEQKQSFYTQTVLNLLIQTCQLRGVNYFDLDETTRKLLLDVFQISVKFCSDLMKDKI